MSARAWVRVLGVGFLAVAVLGIGPSTLEAQDRTSATGTLFVRVRRPDSLPLPGSFVRSARIGTVTDGAGIAQVVLPATLRSVTVSRPGYRTHTFEITIVANAPQRVDIYLDPLRSTRDVVPSPVRPVRRAERAEAPTSLDADGVLEEIQTHPADLITLLRSLPGVMAQPLAGPLDGTRVRINGLPGQNTGVLVDGLPLNGGKIGGFDLLELAPLDLARVDLITGAASALYGPDASAGAINLISQRAVRNTARLAANQSSEKGTDLMFWGSRRASATVGATLSSDFHQQRLVDSDGDTWGEFPRAIRFSIRPRLFVERPNGDELTATSGFLTEDRTGGFLLPAVEGNEYREERRVRQVDAAITGRRLMGGGQVQLRLSGSQQWVSHRFDDLRERDRRTSFYGDVSYSREIGPAGVTGGIGYDRLDFREEILPAFDFTHSVPGAFVQLRVGSSWLSASASGRCDRHNVHGVQCSPRVAVSVEPSQSFRARLTAAGGYFAPTPLTDQVDVLGLHAIIPLSVQLERTQTAGLDLEWRRGPVTLNGSLNLSRLSNPVRLVPYQDDPERRLRFINVAEPTRVAAAQVAASYHIAPFQATAFYHYTYGTEGDPSGSSRRVLGLTPRHVVGTDLNWQGRTSGTAISLEASYVGQQQVWDNPYRTKAPGYGLIQGLLSQRTGRAQLYVSGENLLDVKVSNYESVLLPAPAEGGRRVAAPWAPLRGRVISLGATVDW